MPPLVPRKRLRESPSKDEANAQSKTKDSTPNLASARRKATLYDDLDATSTPQSSSLLHGMGDDDSSSSLSSLSDEEFEDVPPAKRQKAEESEDDDDDMEFEDVAVPESAATDAPITSGDLELTLNRDTRMSLINQYGDKKGPTKREKKVRNATHRLHVLLLLWHNAVRNSWVCDMEVQAIMISHLTPRLWEEVDRWRRSSGLEKAPPPSEPPKGKSKTKGKPKGGAKTKTRGKTANKEESRDWGSAAQRLEEGAVDMSHGDPLFRLMQSLTSWWKQRFKVMAPGLRKQGYMQLERLDRLTKAHKAFDHDADLFGEKISNLHEFRRCARSCRGSRDVGSQLFTALLRGLGLEARMVANLQTLGFGWNKLEDAEPESQKQMAKLSAQDSPSFVKKDKAKTTELVTPTKSAKTAKKTSPRTQRQANKADPIIVDDSENSDKLDLEYKDTDDESIVELESTPRRAAQPAAKFDSDLLYPHYWSEVLSPVTNSYLPVDPIVKGMVATNREMAESLEPRGAKADKARQVMAYIVGFSPDGTAKDVTVRYLKRQIVPGRTKGSRAPIEKVPVYNRHGKVKRYEQFDWFKTAMSGYSRGNAKTPITEVDELEDSTDLKPAQPEKKEVKEGEETLQYYKQSKEFALERHLKREEALKHGAKPVKKFKNKVKGGKIEEEDVFLRSDVLPVKSAETWHKQGRAPLLGEEPLKRVPYRAATTNRRREIMEAEAATGQKVLQGLFSFEQTDWIIPPPIKDGVIPKNDYGNIDLFAKHMCPKGAAHIPYRGAVKVCKRLQIDYAEAVTGFEFGHRMAVPVIHGVVIAEENHDKVLEELEKDEAERARKEDEKRRKAALGKWRKFLMGMRIVERIRQDYGDIDDSVSVFGHNRNAAPAHAALKTHEDEDMAGGFLPEGFVADEEDDAPAQHTSAFFPTVGAEDDDGEDDLVMEDHREQEHSKPEPEEPEKLEETSEEPPTKASKGRATRGAARKKTPAKRQSTRARKKVISDSEDDEDVSSWHGDSEED